MEDRSLELNVLVCNKKGCFTDIRARFVGPGFDGSVVKVIRDGDTTVGIRDDGSPVYIFIKNIETIDAAFHDLSVMVENRGQNKKLLNRIGIKCLKKMQEMMLKYYHKNSENAFDQKKQELSSFLEEVKISYAPACAS